MFSSIITSKWKIEREQTESGQLIVGINELVTYWNQFEWSDEFSSDLIYGTTDRLPGGCSLHMREV